VASQNQNLSQFVDQKIITNQPHISDGRTAFIGKWFRGGSGETEEPQEVNYDLKGEQDDDLWEGQSSDFEDFWGVEREGKRSDSDENRSSDREDDDDDHGGEMMPVIDY